MKKKMQIYGNTWKCENDVSKAQKRSVITAFRSPSRLLFDRTELKR